MHSVDDIIKGLLCKVPCNQCPYLVNEVCQSDLPAKEAAEILTEYRDLKQKTAEAINNVTVNMAEVVHCKDCAFFERDVFGFINGVPIIIAHNSCRAWGGQMGCVTDPSGWCYMARRKDNQCTQNL